MKPYLVLIAGILFGAIIGWFAFPAILYHSSDQPLHFSHNTHTGESGGMACTDCHTTNETGRFQGIPSVIKCAECHASPIGESVSEKQLVEHYITPNVEIPWLVYSRQPDNAYFPHAAHVTLGKMKCEDCHGPHGSSDTLRIHYTNRISGYSRDVWGANISGFSSNRWEGMKMDKCVRCHGDNNRRDGCVSCHK
ncbi:MAG: cytochrome c family protein [Bacteroidetes bacterium]|nr:cytochrome c family protein [Bacteroidota bacterium]